MWQYIIFSYNEKDVDEARKMAQDNGVNFSLCYSSKWLNENEP